MASLTEREEYNELVEKDTRLVVEIDESYLTRQVNTAAEDLIMAEVGIKTSLVFPR